MRPILSDTDKAVYQAALDAGEGKVMTAQTALDRAAQMMVLANAVTALQAIDLSGLTTNAAIDDGRWTRHRRP